MNRPYAKPLILATPKWLLHHHRATSALQACFLPHRPGFRRDTHAVKSNMQSLLLVVRDTVSRSCATCRPRQFTDKAPHHWPEPGSIISMQDFTTGKYFNRVIDDGKASDNTRHLARHSVTGEAHLLPQDQIRRVLLVSGQVMPATQRLRWTRRFLNLARHSSAHLRSEIAVPFHAYCSFGLVGEECSMNISTGV